jgi:hypothetical protein
MRAAVPSIARWLLRVCAPADQRAWLIADLEEEAAARARAHGTGAARRWSARQVAMSVIPLLAQRAEAAANAIRRAQMSIWRGVRQDLRSSQL